ncbi:tryptophan-rich sensory protein, partial [Candidatus Falkowbacteria bacterium]|nr:tryptophan-rich sensory protein [Candidatus Falkowbacteria bacterium]
MNTYNWYQTLIKPAWAPPSWLFGPVWSVLYTIF